MRFGFGFGYASGRRTNPITRLDNVINYTDFTNQGYYTFSSGSDVSSVSPVVGSISYTNDEATVMQYDADLFGGRGGIKTADSNSDVNYESDFSADSSQTIGFVLDTTDAGANDGDIFSLGGSGFGNTKSRVRLVQATNLGLITYGTNDADAFETLVNTGSSGVFLVILKYNSASDVDFTVRHSGGDSTGSFDPDDVFSTSTRVWIGDRGADVGLASVYFAEVFHTSDALTDTEIGRVLGYWSDKYL